MRVLTLFLFIFSSRVLSKPNFVILFSLENCRNQGFSIFFVGNYLKRFYLNDFSNSSNSSDHCVQGLGRSTMIPWDWWRFDIDSCFVRLVNFRQTKHCLDRNQLFCVDNCVRKTEFPFISICNSSIKDQRLSQNDGLKPKGVFWKK